MTSSEPERLVETYRGLDIGVFPPQRFGTLGRETACLAIVSRADEVVFTISVGVSNTLSAILGETADVLAHRFALRQVHGLIDLGRYEVGGEYELTFGEHWDPIGKDSATSDESISREVLEAAERMVRSEASTNQIPELDVDGFAQVLEIDPKRVRELLVLMEIEGLIEAHATTLSRGLRGGELRITSAGLAAIKSLRDSEGGEVGPGSGFRTVVFTDLVGSTEVLRRLGDETGRAAFRDVEQTIEDLCKTHEGRLVKHMGDGSLLTFASPRSALRFSLAVQDALADRSLRLRIGMAAGEPIEEGGDIHGAVVVQASRIMDLAGAGDILVSDAVRQLLLGKGFSFESEGEYQLKGLDEPVKVWRARR